MASAPPAPLPNTLTFDAISEGDRASHTYEITGAVHACLTGPFGDVSPIHVSDEAARQRGFAGRVMHGAILNGFLSHFVGVRFPGENALLHSVNMQYKAPSYMGDALRFDATVTQKVEAVRAIVMEVVIHNLTQDRLAGKAKVQVGLWDGGEGSERGAE